IQGVRPGNSSRSALANHSLRLHSVSPMKNRVGIVVLVLACVILGIALISVKRDVVKERTDATVKIVTFSNKWDETSAKLNEEKRVTGQLYEDLDKRKQAFTELSNSFTDVSNTLAKTQTHLKAREEELKQRDEKIAGLESQNQALDKQAADLSTAITNLTL